MSRGMTSEVGTRAGHMCREMRWSDVDDTKQQQQQQQQQAAGESLQCTIAKLLHIVSPMLWLTTTRCQTRRCFSMRQCRRLNGLWSVSSWGFGVFYILSSSSFRAFPGAVLSSSVKSISSVAATGGRSCNFPKAVANFWRNFDRRLQIEISDKEYIGCSKLIMGF